MVKLHVNKPIRTISIFCLLLFLALMLNATYLQYWKAGELNDGPAQPPGASQAAFSRERGAILVGRDAGRRERAVRRPVQVPAHLPPAVQVRPGHRLVLLLQPDRHRAQPRTTCSPATTPGCSSPSWSTWSATTPPRAATSQLTLDPAAQTAAFDGLAALGPATSQGAVVAHRADAPARSWRWSSLPTYDPNKLASHDFARGQQGLRPAQRRPGPAAAQPRHPDHAAARLDVQARHRRGGDRERQLRRRLDGARRRRRTSCRRPRAHRPDRQRGPRLRHRPDPVHARRWRTPATPPSRRSAVEVGADAMHEQAEAFGFNEHYLDDLGPQADLAVPRRTWTSRRPASPASASSRCRRRRCRWRWSAAGIANGGTVMKPYLVDEVQSPELDVLDKTEPERALPGGRRRRPPTS